VGHAHVDSRPNIVLERLLLAIKGRSRGLKDRKPPTRHTTEPLENASLAKEEHVILCNLLKKGLEVNMRLRSRTERKKGRYTSEHLSSTESVLRGSGRRTSANPASPPPKKNCHRPGSKKAFKRGEEYLQIQEMVLVAMSKSLG